MLTFTIIKSLGSIQMPELLYELLSLLAKEAVPQAELSKWVLSLRYSHRHNLPSLLAFSVLLLGTTHPNHPRQPNFTTLEQLIRLLLLQADYHSTLLIYAKLMPLLQWAEGKTQKEVEEILGASFREFTRPQSWSGVGVGKQGGKEGMWEGRKCMAQLIGLLRLLEARNYFLFYFNLINGTGDSLENDIDCYFLELASSGLQEQGVVSSSELAILQRNIEHEYGKLRKRKYQQEVVESAYIWLEVQTEGLLMFQDKGQLAIEVLAQVIRSQSNLAGATLLQVMDACIENMEAGRVRLFLEVVDGCILEGSFRIATQAILFLVCTVFGKIRTGKLRVEGQTMMEHLILWKEVALRRQLPAKLLICLIQWLPFLYQTPIPKQQEPEILHLYRKEILRLARGEGSELSGLRVLVQELEHRKMEGVYMQLEEFHSKMEHPEPLHSAKSSHLQFHFRTSALSKSNSQINSLLDSLHSIQQARSQNAQLEIISKSQRSGSFASGSFASSPSQRSLRECVQIIMSLIDLFDYRVRESSQADRTHTTNRQSSHPNSHPSSISNPVDLPVLSTHQALSKGQSSELDCSGEIRINATNYSEQAKRRLAKGRGLIVRNQCMEVGYQFDSKEAKLCLYITFLQPVNECSLRLRENSFKLKGQKEAVFSEPRINQQLKMASVVSHVKLYCLQGVPNSERIVRSRIIITIAHNRKQTEEVHDIPVGLYSLLEPFPHPVDLQLPEPFMYTPWHQVCPKFAKHGYEYISKFLPCIRDNKGNYLLQCQLLGQHVIVRVVVVQEAVRVEARGARIPSELVASGLLEVLL